MLGLTGLCTDPNVPDAAAELAAWSARYAGVLGLSRVRIPTTIARLRDYYPALGFELGSEIDMGKNRTLWEFYCRAR